MPNTLGIATILLFFLAIGSTQQQTSSKGGCETLADPCDSAGSQRDMNFCYGEQYKKADAHLNAVYRDLISRFTAGSS